VSPSERKPKTATKPDNPEQYRRFVEAAREVENDESPDAMDRAFERVVKPKKLKDETEKPKGAP
jgi:hypothetical protein